MYHTLMEALHKDNNTRSNGTATTTNPPDIRLDEDNNENDWTRVDYRNNGRKSWRQKANILRGTAKCKSKTLSAAIHLVVYGLATHVVCSTVISFHRK